MRPAIPGGSRVHSGTTVARPSPLLRQQSIARPFTAASKSHAYRRRSSRRLQPRSQADWTEQNAPWLKRLVSIVRPETADPTARSRGRPGAPGLEAERAPSARAHRLEVLVAVRKLYRNLLRADVLLADTRPVYEPAAARPADADAGAQGDAAAAEEAARVRAAVARVAEMSLTAEQLGAELKAVIALEPTFGAVLEPGGAAEAAAAQERVTEAVRAARGALKERLRRDLRALPFPSLSAAQAAVERRNARYRALSTLASTDADPEGAGDATTLARRLGNAEQAAGEFVQRRLQPAVRKVSTPRGLVDGVKTGARWAQGVWGRLNGGAAAGGGGGAARRGARPPAPASLPLPPPQFSEEERAARTAALTGRIESLERQLQEASKAREARLRRAGPSGRLRAAAELRAADERVGVLSSRLAILALQAEMEAIHCALEDEALDIVDGYAGGGGAARERAATPNRLGSSDEVALLIAEFKVLDEELAPLAAALEEDELVYIEAAELARLADDIIDLRTSMGLGDTQVFGGGLFNMARLQFQVKEGIGKLLDGVDFGARGLRLLGSDTVSAFKLIGRAAAGGTLKPREVQALRRTFRDVLTFIPFTIILILPLTPVGHVLIFGFIQRYFPGLFPSQFTSRRQELMSKYETLKEQLQAAQQLAEQEGDELEFQRAAAAAAAELGKRWTGEAGAAGMALQPGAAGAGAQARPSWKVAEEEEGEEGPAAAAVRSLKERLERAAKLSYTDPGEAGGGN
uniref:Letm1 RBD domain-containing protein n=1 Tax=Auxenochlorella protothecoides TaxID=3075 RepID=A0A1D1ZV50_AUXPR